MFCNIFSRNFNLTELQWHHYIIGASKMYKLVCAPIEDSDQTANLRSLIRVFDGRSMGS